MSIFNGKSMFVWPAGDLFGGVPSKYASEAKRLGLRSVGFKIANGVANYNSDSLLFAIIDALRAVGVAVWGWHYVYGYDPIGEANKAIERVNKFGLDAYVINAEAEYKEAGKATAAARYMTQLRAGLPTLPIGLSSYRYPNVHMQLPWKEFLSRCDFNSPQVYWMLAHNPGWQLTESLRQFRALEQTLGLAPLPFYPTGAAFKESGWQPTAADLDEFDAKAKELQLPGVLWYRWGHAVMLGFDDVIAKHIWAVQEEPPPDLQPFPTETAMPLRPVLLKDKVALQSDVALTGANNTGVALTIPNLPANVKALKLWLIVKSDKPGAFVFFGPGSLGEQRFHFGARAQAVNLEADEHGDVLLDGAKLWRQHNALGGTVRYWLFLTGYFVDAPDVDLTSILADITTIYGRLASIESKNNSQDGTIGSLAGRVAAIEAKLAAVKERL